MKITKAKLKQIILEEVQSDPELVDAIGKLTDTIENLDVSIDFLSAAFTGESGVSIGAAQRQLGRAARPKARLVPEPVKESSEQQLSQDAMDAAQDVAGQELSFEKWIAVVFQKGAEIGDKSPNPYDAWMSGQSPEEYASALSEGLLGDIFTGKKKAPKPGKKRKMTDREREKVNRFLASTGADPIEDDR